METQEIHTSDPCPKGIVNQLLEIAKENDAMNEIGGATGWRWQEGIISRMPKTKTVAKILRKAYGTEDPRVWYQSVDGDLKKFVKNAYSISDCNQLYLDPQNIFEAVCYLSLIDGRGITLKELSNRLSFIKFAQSFQDEDYFIEINEDLIIELNGKWAKEFASNTLRKWDVNIFDGFYKLESNTHNSSEKLVRYQIEISALRNKMVGNNSHFDMWKYYSVALSDTEMIEVELKLIEYYKELLLDISIRTKKSFRDPNELRSRLFSISSITLPMEKKEGLK